MADGGRLFMWGKCSRNEQERPVMTPTAHAGMFNTTILQVVCGSGFTAVITGKYKYFFFKIRPFLSCVPVFLIIFFIIVLLFYYYYFTLFSRLVQRSKKYIQWVVKYGFHQTMMIDKIQRIPLSTGRN